MYEEKKTKTSRSVSFKVFYDLPWAVRAFFNLLIMLLVAIAIFGFLAKFANMPAFNQVVEELSGFLKLIVGAIIGSLTSEAKNRLQRKDADV